MDTQNYNTFQTEFQTGNTDSMYPLERTETNGEYWNDLLVEALGPNSQDGIPSNVDGDFKAVKITLEL